MFILTVFPLFYKSNLVAPLQRLVDGVKQAESGDLSVQVAVSYNDEIGYVTNTFNSMTGQLHSLLTNLEQLVEERTKDLQDSQERFKGLSASTFEGVVIHDKGVILDSNQAVEELFGYSQAELIGKHVNDLITVETRMIATKNIESGYEGPYELAGLRKNVTAQTIQKGAATEDLGEALEIGYQGFGEIACSEAAKEGITAFLERRKPEFKK